MNPSICDSLDFVHGSGVSCSNVISHTFRSFKANKTYDMRSSEGEYSKPELLHLISLIFNSGRGILISLLKWARMYPSHTQCVQTRSLTQLCSSCAVSLQWRLSTIFTAVCDYTSTWCIQGQAARICMGVKQLMLLTLPPLLPPHSCSLYPQHLYVAPLRE